jgi:hypothetical protein
MNHSIRDFFEKHVLLLHEKLKSGKITYLHKEFRTDEASYFSEPLHPEFLYLKNISLEDEAECRASLENCWENEPELLKLVPDLVKLAFKLKEENMEQTSELSPFVYTMF